MRQNDYLLIGVELYAPDKVRGIISHYQNQDLYDAIFVPLKYAGLQQHDGHFHVTFDEQTKDVEVSLSKF